VPIVVAPCFTVTVAPETAAPLQSRTVTHI